MYKHTLLILSALGILFLLTCSSPQNPFTQGDAKVFLRLESSSKINSDSTITDTTGNTIRIGVVFFMPEYFDSVVIMVQKSIQDVDTFFVCKKPNIGDSTAWFSYSFKSVGTRTVNVTGYVQGGYRPTASGTITILPRPVNRKPSLIISGKTAIAVMDTCTLFVSANDSDTAQTHSYKVLKAPSGYSFANQIFTWKPTTPNDTGIDSVVFVVADNGVPVMSDTQTVLLTVKGIAPAIDTIKPVIRFFDPAKDSISVNANSYTVKVVSKDTSGVASVVFTIGATNFPATRNADTVWSAAVSGLVSGEFNKITVVATDASVNANKDTLTFYLKYDPTITDLTGPVFFQKIGPANNAIVADSIVNIVDSIYDPSGVDSVSWTLNGKNPKSLALVSGATNPYSIIDTLRRYHLDTIVVYAQDKSSNGNKSSQTIVLNYNVPPVVDDTSLSTNRNAPKTWVLNARSIDGDSLSWSRLTSPSASNGSVTGALPSVTFTPATNWAGVDSFNVRVTDGYWSDTAKIRITVVNVLVAPSIDTQPASATKNVGQSVTFSVVVNANVNPAPWYQWKHNGANIPNATSPSYTLGTVALSDSGSYTVTITNGAGTATSQTATLTVNFAPSITTQPLSQILYLGQPTTFTVLVTGQPTPTFQWRKNGTAINGATTASYTISSPGVNDSGKYTVSVSNSVGSVTSDTAAFYARIKSISAGGNHSMVLKTDGTLWAFGENSHGQLGDGTTTNSSTAKQIMDSVQSIAAGGFHSLILKTNNTLFSCGWNGNGQLGDGTGIDRSTPVQIMAGLIVKSIAAGNDHSLILTSDGYLFACGDNGNGQYGNGTTADAQNTPMQVNTISTAKSIAAGYYHSLLIVPNGILLACGSNSTGQLGDGTGINQQTPVQIMTGVQNIAAGGNHSLILTTNGTLFACGSNSNGQVGDGSYSNDSVPKQIITGVQSIAAGENHTLFVKSDGTLFACGANSNSQLGDGTTADQHSPEQIMAGVQSVAAGEYHSLILTTDGRLFACGFNYYGELGDGTTITRSSPVEIRF